MPAMGVGGGGGPAPAPRGPAPPPIIPAPKPAAPRVTGVTDTQMPGPSDKQVTAYKQSPAYHHAVAAVFKAQPTAQKGAIIRGIVTRPGAFKTPEGQAVMQAWHGLAINERVALQRFLPHPQGLDLSGIGNALNPANVYGGKSGGNGGVSGIGTAGMFGGLKGAQQIGKNAVSDLYKLPKQTVEGLYGVGNELVQGHAGNALHMLVDPFVRTFLHPGQSFYQHPVDTALQFFGPKAVVGRAAGGIARSGALGERAAQFANTAREPLRLPGVAGHRGPPIQARSFSRDLSTLAAQKAIARVRGEKANVVQPPRVMPGFVQSLAHAGPAAKIRQIGNEMTAVRQMVGRTERGVAMKVLMKAAPHQAVRNIVTHILQGVVRTPETAVRDIHAEISRLEPHAAESLRKPSVAQARLQIRDLKLALANQQHLPDAFRAAAEIRPHLHAADAYLSRLGLLQGEQALRSRLMPYAMAHMGAHMEPGHGLSLGENPLSTEHILEHVKANGVPDPAYVGHYPGKIAPWRFYSAYRGARGSLGQKRTGEAFRVGNYDHSYKALVAQGARTAEAITKAGLHDRIVSRFGVTRPDGRDFTPVEAKRFAYAAIHDENGNPKPGIEYVPITRAPFTALDHVRDLQNPHELTDRVNQAEINAVDRAVRDVESRTDSRRNVTLVPKAAVDQFREQFKQQGGIARELGRFTQQFRRTVLPYSTHWMFQIGTEAGLRGLLGGVLDPRNLVAGHQLVRSLEGTPEGRAALSEMVQAVFYNQHDTLGIHHSPNALVAGARTFPPSRALIAAHTHYADLVGHGMSQFEHEFRVMGLGKLARQEVQEFTRSWQGGIKLQGQNLAALADKLKADPNLVAKFGRQIDGIFGKYNKFAPKTRAAIQSFAPFLPWYLNAARFVLWHLPVKSPVASSLLASLRQTINQDIQQGKAQPLDDFSMEQLARLSPFGIGAYPTAKGMSPVGAMALKDVTGVFLPELEGSIYNLTGSNSFGAGALKGPNGDVKPGSGAAVRSALENFAEATVPGTRYLREAREGTASSYGTSTLLQPQGKGAKLGAGILGRILNPLYSFEQAKKRAASSSSGFLLGAPSGGSNYLLGSGSGSSGYLLP